MGQLWFMGVLCTFLTSTDRTQHLFDLFDNVGKTCHTMFQEEGDSEELVTS